MVISEEFAWAHLPKAAGDATAALFMSLRPGIVISSDDPASNDKHAPFADRHDAIDGKLLALNIRRLPSWILSYYQHAATRGLHPTYQPVPMASPVEMARSTLPDDFLARYTAHGHYRISFWLRVDYLVEDFIAFVSRFVELTTNERDELRATGNVNKQEYDHDIRDWFTRGHIVMMYENNPHWRNIEASVFGNLLEERFSL